MNQTFNQSHPRMIRLRRQSRGYSFFQAMRDIESVADVYPRLGEASSPTQEAVRIAQSPDLSFAPTAIEDVHKDTHGRVRLNQRFFGMLGPSGPLPIHMTELVRNRTRHAHDPTLQAFLNLFHHRMSMLFYRAWSSSRPAIQRDRPWQDRFAVYVGALAGYGLRASRNVDRFADETKWFFSGRLASIRRNPEGLESIVSETLQCPVRVVQFRLQRLPISPDDRTVLGRQSSVLGQSAVVGKSVADRQSGFELRIGPMDYSKFQQLLPGQKKRRSLDDGIKNYSGLGMNAFVRLVLDKNSVPQTRLGAGRKLGRDAWLHAKPPANDPDDCCHPM